MKRIFGTKKDKEPPKTLEQVSGDLDVKAQEYALFESFWPKGTCCDKRKSISRDFLNVVWNKKSSE